MRIISDFRDYYDTVQSYGQDQTLIFNRKRVELDDSHPLVAALPFFTGERPERHLFRHHVPELAGRLNGRNIVAEIRRSFVLFCARRYNFYQIDLRLAGVGGSVFEIHRFYNFDELAAFFDAHEIKFDTTPQKKLIEHAWWRVPPLANVHVARRYFDMDPDAHREDLINHKVVIATQSDLNACLGDVQFYKVMDAFSAFQEIEMFLGGVLGGVAAPMIEIADEHKIAEHGFDHWSFRKPPTKKK